MTSLATNTIRKAMCLDVETTGFSNASRIVQMGWAIVPYETLDCLLTKRSHIIKPIGFDIPNHNIHTITKARAMLEGVPFKAAMDEFKADLSQVSILIGHNVPFDVRMTRNELLRYDKEGLEVIRDLESKSLIDTLSMANKLRAVDPRFRNTKLGDLYANLFSVELKNAHNAIEDVLATLSIFDYIRKTHPTIVPE